MIEHPVHYKMSISLNALNHLGINLYSNVPAVLSELVANAYDANATKVHIVLGENQITIQDDGDGMTHSQVNDRYLTIGYDRRKSQPGLTRLGRPPMGRKGIGKLAVFSIADVVDVFSVHNPSGERSGLRMSRLDIQQRIEGENRTENNKLEGNGEENRAEADRTYNPDPLSVEDLDIEHGTLLVLKNLRRTRTVNLTESYLRRRLARRFTVIGARHNFRIYIDGNEVTVRDRGFFDNLEFVWFFGQPNPDIEAACFAVKKKNSLPDVVDESCGYRVTGWIGTVKEPSQLGERSEEGNSIVIFARGKLIQENILPEFREARVFAQYLIGDIEADFIDVDDMEDLATSDRQRIIADDPRYQSLKAHVERAVKAIGLQWTELRTEEGGQSALDILPIKDWYDRLTRDNQKQAKKLLARIYSLPASDSQTRIELYKASILAFEKLALQGQLFALDEISTDEGLEGLLSIFRSVDELEAVHYHEIARGRLSVINKFENLVDGNAKERVLQSYLFEHLWLLDPSWERASGTERLEQSVKTEFDDVTGKLTEDERKGRIDIRYSTRAGKHVIVELKKYDVVIDVHDLARQVAKYRSALKKMLNERFPDFASWHIEIVCVLGSSPSDPDPATVTKTLDAVDARYVTYDQLISGAQGSYKDYLDKQKYISDIAQIMQDLDATVKSRQSESDAQAS